MPSSLIRHLKTTRYPAIRRMLPDESKLIRDDILETLLMDQLPGADPIEVENFMRTLRRVGRTVAPIAQKALPGIVQGAMQGGMMAGPWGALAGAVGGGAASLLSGGGSPAQAPPAPSPAPGPTASPSTPAAPVPSPPQSPAGTRAPAGPAAASPVAQLLWLISRPETLQALSAMLLAGNRQPAVTVGNRQVPAVAFANAISEAAAQVAEAVGFTAQDDSYFDYLQDEEGSMRCDAGNPEARTSLLISDLVQQSLSERARDESAADEPEDEAEPCGYFDVQYEDDVSDAMDAYEAALEGWDEYDQ